MKVLTLRVPEDVLEKIDEIAKRGKGQVGSY